MVLFQELDSNLTLTPTLTLPLPLTLTLQELDSYTLRWLDGRVRQSACAGAVQSMLSMAKEDAKSDIARQAKRQNLNRFWIPQLSANGLVPGFDLWDDRTAFALGPTASLSQTTRYDILY